MAIRIIGSELANGTVAGSGNIFIEKDGVILRRPSSQPLTQEEIATEFGGRFAPELLQFSQAGKLLPPQFAQELAGLDQFRDEGEKAASPFFDKDLDLINREISTIESQRKADKELAEKFQGEQETQFFRNEDTNFARQLEQAQGGFAGRGTFTSGFRQGALEDLDVGREAGLEGARTQFGQQTEQRNLGFAQFLESQALQKERAVLGVDRGRESAILNQQQRFADDKNQQRSFKRQERFEDFEAARQLLVP